MTVDPATIRAAILKPGGREAVLVREVPDLAGPKLQITLAEVLPGGRGYRAERSIGIGPAIRDAFVVAVGSLRTAKPEAEAIPARPTPAGLPAAPEKSGAHR